MIASLHCIIVSLFRHILLTKQFSKCIKRLPKIMKIVVGRRQGIYLMRQFELSTLEYYFLFAEFLVESKLMDIDLFLPKRRIFNIYVNHIYSIHSQEAEAVTMLTFKRCRDIDSRV
jgi:hypothetical protein